MQIVKFRIRNYKSIRDSGDCYPTNTVTIFAGKNEAGKTSILEALEDFNTDKEIRPRAKPIDQSKLDNPVISVTFEVLKEEIINIFEKIDCDSPDIETEKVKLTLEKELPNNYKLADETVELLGVKYERVPGFISKRFKVAYPELEALLHTFDPQLGSVPFPALSEQDYTTFNKNLLKYDSQIKNNLPNIPDREREDVINRLNELTKLSKRASTLLSCETNFIFTFLESMPNFILFSSFDDIFPNIIPLTELADNPWVKDLKVISDLDVDTITGEDDRAKAMHRNKLNVDINKEYRKFWEQDLSRLEIEWDNQNLKFWIVENGNYYEPEIRGQGRRWHMAFYVKVSARSREAVENVILIDEPGLYLHAKAQRDILRKLEEAGKQAQVFFSTHSPYLLEADKLERIRLVVKDDTRGTIIENKIHKVADKDTLTPILTAIGVEMSTGIVDLERRKNVIVEGPSDYYYLNAFKKIEEMGNFNFVFGGGSGNMPMIGTILQGWGCDVIYLYDNDKAAKDAMKQIKRKWVTTTADMIATIPIEGAAIEDVFSKSDYAKYIIGDPEADIQDKNSDYAKKKGDKVLPAKLFRQWVETNTFKPDDETNKNIENLSRLMEGKFDRDEKE